MWKENKVTSLLNIDYPIIQAGMAGGVTTPELVAAVSKAGGLGTIGAGYMNEEDLRQAIRSTKRLTSKPFGVNVFVPEDVSVTASEIDAANELLQPFHRELQVAPTIEASYSSAAFQKQIDVIIEEGVPTVSFTFGIPAEPIIYRLKSHAIRLIGTATTVKEALLNEQAGMDMVVAQGSEAGGHRGTFDASFEQSAIGTMSLVPRVADNVSLPVIAAGGIMDARGFLAAAALGAEGIQMGTAFLTVQESGAKSPHKEAILNSDGDDTVITSAFSGKPARGIENAFSRYMRLYEHNLPAYPVMNTLTKEIRKAAGNLNRPEFMSLWAGQSASLSRETSAGQLVKQIVQDIKIQSKR